MCGISRPPPLNPYIIRSWIFVRINSTVATVQSAKQCPINRTSPTLGLPLQANSSPIHNIRRLAPDPNNKTRANKG
jgi:hypothetical protein